MHQPIRWHEFGEEAFAAARAADKPVLLDIGAVWCHWCHVMDRESYDDAEVAAIVNEHYIAVKVDRDERPDIDSRYQAAVSALSGQGGWPLTAFLTPDGKPFYGGTYFPPADGYGRPSFKRVLLSIAAAYREKHGDVLEQARMVESAIARAESASAGGGAVSASVIDAILESARGMFDEVNGGFGSAPKFPHPAVLDLVMEQYARSRERGAEDGDLRTVFAHTLEKMARGGVYDQLAGGFHRYSVDERWIVPHFEKMCYDNSELLKNYVHAYSATGDEFFAGVVRDIVRWMDEWLSDRARGGFYASQDADYSMDDDGDYFTWTLAEAKAVLSEDEAAVATAYYGIREVGDMHHNRAKNVLHVTGSVAEIARGLNIPEERAGALLAAAREKMYAARLARPTPYVDKTIYSGWNAMCVSAHLEAAKVLDLAEARHFALRSLDRLLAEGWTVESKATAAGEGARSTLRHVIAYSEAFADARAERREVSGVLEDYAFAVIACLDAYEATADLSYFRFARSIGEAMVEGFFDPVAGGFFDTRATSGQGPALGILGTRRKPFQDSPTPAGNSAAAIALLRLHSYAGDSSGHDSSHHDSSHHNSSDHSASYRDMAEQTLEVYAGVAGQHGIFAATYGLALVRFLQPHTQVVVVGRDAAAAELYRAAVRPLSLCTAVLRLDADQAIAQNLPPALAETIPSLPALGGGRSFAVVCSGSACQPPIYDALELERVVGPRARPAA